MSSGTDAACLSPEMLAAYFTGGLTDAQEMEVEAHLAVCEACTVDAWELQDLQAAWNSWTARAHGESYWRARLGNALAAAEQSAPSPEWRDRLSRWQERFAAAAQGVVRVVVEESARASRIVTGGLEALSRPDAAWRFTPVPAAIPAVPAAIRTRGAAPVRSAVGQTSTPVTAVVASGQPQARVAVSEDGRVVEVRLQPVRAGQALPLVLLIPEKEDAEPHVREPERHGDTDYWLARFEGLEPGDYLVVFEPAG